MKKSLNTDKIVLLFITIFLFASCTNEPKQPEDNIVKPPVVEVKKIPTPDFNADSAYSFVKAQVDFGPRIPGTKAHANCADYFITKLKSYGCETFMQSATIQTFDKKQFKLKNIIGAFNPNAKKRIIICSHWDTRPWADGDKATKDKTFDSANDGPSGVGVALEIARLLNNVKPELGIDFIFFDLEDYGTSNDDESWCLGSKYWAKNMHKPNYYADYGILMDMVGAANAMFPKEKQSVDYASSIVDKVWNAASRIGYSNYFAPQVKFFVGNDDHIPLNEAGIPCIDIIEYNQATGGFGDYHHTVKDNMDIIDKKTLKAVGQTLLEVIYSEK